MATQKAGYYRLWNAELKLVKIFTERYNIRSCCLSIFLVIVCSTFVAAQNNVKEISGGLELGLPNNALEDVVVAGFGLSMRYEKGFSERMSWLADTGFILFTGKNGGNPITAIPVQVGCKYYFQKNMMGFYGMAELGVHSFLGGEGASGTNFSFAPAVGYHLKKYDVGVKYETICGSWISASYLGVRIAYIFSCK